jgi:GTP pyrophosphokinase
VQFQNNGQNERRASDSAYVLSGAPLEQQYQIASYLGDEAADRQHAFTHTYAELMFLARCVDPGVQLSGRIKSADSILGKMSASGAVVYQLMDIIGIRAIFQNTRDCYRLVKRIRGEFEVLEHEYDDYIAIPKPNGYQSVHVTVISSCGFPVEFQIRTQRMHRLAERGTASHMQYKKDRVPWKVVLP